MTTKELSPKEKRIYFITLAVMIITGAFNTIFTSLQNSSYTTVLGSPFVHPWYQSLQMFIGEAYCAIVWVIYRNKIRKNEEMERIEKGEPIDNRPEPNPFLFAVSASMDVIGTTLLNFALVMMDSSIFQMLRGGIVIVTCCFSIIFLKKYPKNYHWLGIFLVFFGIVLVGFASQQEGSQIKTDILGIFMLLASLIFTGIQFGYQEAILIKYKTSSLQLIAWEGVFGCIITSILLAIFEYVPCNFDKKEYICPMNENKEYYLEQTIFAFKQMYEAWPILVYGISQSISICLFNYFGVQISKYSSSATRAVMDSARTVLVWVFFMFIPVNGKTNNFKGLQLAGFIVLVLGQLIYNQLVTVNFAKMDKHYNNKLIIDNQKSLIKVDENNFSNNKHDLNDKLLITVNESSRITT